MAVKALKLGAFRCLNKNGDPEKVYAELTHCIQQASRSSRNEKLGKCDNPLGLKKIMATEASGPNNKGEVYG